MPKSVWDMDMNDFMGKSKTSKRTAVSTSIKNEVLKKQNYKCYKCKKPLPAVKHFHHKRAVAKGGKSTLGNLMALCPNCHSEIHHKEKLKKANAKARGKSKSKNPYEIDFKMPKFKL